MDSKLFGFEVVGLVLAIVEAAKGLGLENDKAKQALALGLGIGLGALSAVVSGGVPTDWVGWTEIAVLGLVHGLTAMGIYSGAKRIMEGLAGVLGQLGNVSLKK